MAGVNGRIPVGHFVDIKNGRFGQTDEDDVRKVFKGADSRDHLVLHFHGGLVPREAAHETGMRLHPFYADTGAYPVFIVWNSGVEDTIEAMIRNSGDTLFTTFVSLIESVTRRHVGNRTPGRMAVGPQQASVMLVSEADIGAYLRQRDVQHAALEQEIRDALAHDPYLIQVEDLIVRGFQPASLNGRAAASPDLPDVEAPRSFAPDQLRPEVREEIRSAARSEFGRQTLGLRLATGLAMFGVKVMTAVVSRYLHGTDHGFDITVQQEAYRALYLDVIGSAAWGTMKGMIDQAFGAGNPGDACLDHLESRVSCQRATRVTLVGHSAGAIYVQTFLDHAAKREWNNHVTFDVVLLAAACTVRSTNGALKHFQNASLVPRVNSFGLDDQDERGYWEHEILLNGSLLYCIAGLLEASPDEPLLGMQRYFKMKRPHAPQDRAIKWFEQNDRVVWAGQPQNPQGLHSAAKTHTGFLRDDLTLQSLETLLRSTPSAVLPSAAVPTKPKRSRRRTT